jgi:hypothetical protein
MAVTFALPPEVERNLRQQLGDLDQAAKEALLLESFRRGTLSHYELSQALSLDRYETDAFLKKHEVLEGSLTSEDLELQRQALDRALGQADR